MEGVLDFSSSLQVDPQLPKLSKDNSVSTDTLVQRNSSQESLSPFHRIAADGAAREDYASKVGPWLNDLPRCRPPSPSTEDDHDKCLPAPSLSPSIDPRALSQSVLELAAQIPPHGFPECPQTSPTRGPNPGPKIVRKVLRQASQYVNDRVAFMSAFDEVEAILNGTRSHVRRLEEEVQELVWTRYCIEEDVLKKMKHQHALVDGTEKLGKGNVRGEEWKTWVTNNINTNTPLWYEDSHTGALCEELRSGRD